MKKTFFNYILVVFSFASQLLCADAQVATNYLFSQSSGTYTPITGGSVVVAATDVATSGTTSLDGGTYALPLPFSFSFNGTSYTTCNVNVNGYITFGTTAPTATTSTPISSTTAYSGAISPMARDLWGCYNSSGSFTTGSNIITGVTDFTGIYNGAILRSVTVGTGIPTGATVSSFDAIAGTITMSVNATATSANVSIIWPIAEIRAEAIGTAPLRTFVIQFKGMADFATTVSAGGNLNFQIQIDEANGIANQQVIRIVYGPTGNLLATARTSQVGLRGAANTDYNNRLSTTDWAATTAGIANTSSVTRTNAIFPAPGLTYTWAPPIPCIDPPTAGTTTVNSTLICSGGILNLNLTGHTTGTGQTYQWESSPALAGTYTSVGTSQSNSPKTINPTTSAYYRCAITCGANTMYSTPILVSINSGVSGTYTINSAAPASSTNFQTYTAAINAMACGITGPVTFNVAPASGPYTEQVVIPQITGASATNRITFNGNGTTVQFAPVTANRHIVKLDGADYVTLKNIRVLELASDYVFGIHLMNDANFDSIVNCKVDVSANTSTTSTQWAGIAASGTTTSPVSAGNAANNLVISGCTVIGGYYGISLSGTSATASRCFQNQIINDTITDHYSIGIQIINNDSCIIKGNDISRANLATVTTFEGIEVAGGNKRCFISNNRIHDTHNAATTQTGAAYGIFNSANDAPVDSVIIISNNLIYNFNSTGGIIYGLYNSSSDGVRYYHNTVVLDNQSATAAVAYGFYQTTLATNIQLRNNTIFVSRSGIGNRRCLHFNTATSVITSNYNNLYMASTGGTVNEIGYSTSGYTTLAAWQAGASQDANSISVDPLFVNAATADFKPTDAGADDKGTFVGVPEDIFGTPRSVTTPDIGAIEFHIPLCVAPPVAGNTLTDNATTCKGQLFLLSFDNTTTTGAGQTYQWQTSATPSGTYTDIPGQTAANASVSQNDSNWYRVAITCSGLTSNTAPVSVFTNPATLPTVLTIDTTIAVSASNYHSLASLAAELNCKGISGPTTITYAYRNTTARDSANFISIPGSSAVNTVTLIGKGNTLVSGTAPVISFAKTSYFVWDSLNITLTAATGIAMHMTNQSHHITIRNSVINAGKTATASTNAAIAVSGLSTNATTVGNNGQYITIENNKIIGGYYGITMIGNVGYLNNNSHIIRNNTVSDFYNYGIYLLHADTILIEKNDISRPTRTAISNFYGIHQNQSRYVKTLSNRIHNSGIGGYTAYPIYILNSLNTAGYESEVINNLIYDIQTEDVFYGIYATTTNVNGFKIYHNTISYNTPAASTSAIRGLSIGIAPANVDFRNNIISITGLGTGIKTGIYVNATSATFTSNRNNIHVATTGTGANNIGYWGAANITLANWQTASLQDANSVSTNPAFNSATNPAPLSVAIDDMGTPVGVLFDILGNTRSATAPDIGAFEFTGVAGDLSIQGTEMLKSSICYSTNDTLKVTVKNVFGATVDFNIDPLMITWNVTGPVLSNGTILINSGILAAGNSLTVFTTDVNRNASGNYIYSVYIGSNAVNTSTINDTLNGLTSTVKPFLVVSPKTATVTTPTQTVMLNASSPLISSSSPFFSEICHWRGATGAAPAAGWPTYLIADDYVEITGVPSSDLSGYTMEVWVTTAIQHTVTFPTGTLFSPTGTMIIATGQLGASVPSPANFYYHSGNSTTYGSTDDKGYVLRFPNGTIANATTYGPYIFPAASGVTTANWSGTNPGVSSAGIRLIAPANNTSSSWATESATQRQDPNTLNAAVTAPSATPLSGFDWNYLGSSFSTTPTVTVGPYTTPGVYTYVASFTNVCGTFYDTARITASATVPVTLLQFTATPSNDDVLLNWATASELNSSHFEIERSVNGKSFERITNVKAKGTSSNKVSYRHLDEKAFSIARNNTLYYRLKMIDKDGTFEYSKTAIVSIQDTKASTPLTVFPNPYTDKTYININTTQATDATISVVDITGKVMFTYTETVAEGSSTLTLQQSETLKTGIYFVSIEMNGEKQMAKLVKQ